MVLSIKTTTTSVCENNSITMSTSAKNQNNLAIVSKCIAPFKELIPFQDLFVNITAMLKDNFMKEAVCQTALDMAHLQNKRELNLS